MENSRWGQADRPVVGGPTNREVSPTGMKSRALIGQNPAGKDQPAAVGPPPRRHRKKSFNIGPACRSRAKQMSSRYPKQELHLRMPSWYILAMMETKASQQTLAA